MAALGGANSVAHSQAAAAPLAVQTEIQTAAGIVNIVTAQEVQVRVTDLEHGKTDLVHFTIEKPETVHDIKEGSTVIVTYVVAGEKKIIRSMAPVGKPTANPTPSKLLETGGVASLSGTEALPTTDTLPSGVEQVGVYYKNKTGAWTQLKPEVVNFKSGGAIKSFATNGIVKGDKNGHLPGASAKLSVTNPSTFLFYVPEGTAAAEYQLLKLRVNSDNRELRSVTGGVFHNSTGGTRDNVEFTANKIGPRLYEIVLDPNATAGEYGILPPGNFTSSSAANAGKMYTFHLVK